ncbi:hypothetical protein [Nocardia terpenica]|uniref:DUF8020 domain-containing protein n=1 Tax=Nocardia terpenica TaxID=455432 RepID=A0A164H8Y6_9NOCA|nr:hypothetical protein [Nocardia terpenica]KZM68301.1 hypothetical protein AWN90_10405 [Nocardia terpenica]
MLMRKFAATSVMLIAALGVTAGTANAAPADDAGAVNYKATTTDKSTIIQTDAGSLDVENGVFKIKAADGATLAGTDLKFRVDDFEFPIAADIAGRTATLTPQFDLAHAVYKPVDLPYQDTAPWKTPYDREQAAWNRMKDTIATGATIGTLIGGLGGGAVGCVLGGIAGATVATAAIVGLFGAFVPAAVIGCLGGIIAVGALGTLAGQLLVTAPVAIAAAVQYFTTINAPFTPAK